MSRISPPWVPENSCSCRARAKKTSMLHSMFLKQVQKRKSPVTALCNGSSLPSLQQQSFAKEQSQVHSHDHHLLYQKDGEKFCLRNKVKCISMTISSYTNRLVRRNYLSWWFKMHRWKSFCHQEGQLLPSWNDLNDPFCPMKIGPAADISRRWLPCFAS